MRLVQAKVLPVDSKFVGKILDHTYVVSEENDVWECNGRFKGGKDNVSGYGDLNISRCIGKNNTGIVYGVTGVCHQMSNRVLASVGVELEGVGGYLLSTILYGTHGIDAEEWQERKYSCGLEGVGASTGALTNVLLEKRSEVLATQPRDVLVYNPYGAHLLKKMNMVQFDSISSHSKNWKLQFLSDAIDYSKNTINRSEYVVRVNNGADKYVHKIAKSASYSKVSKFLGFPVNKGTKVILLEESDFINQS